MKLYKHLIFLSIFITGIVIMVVAYILGNWYNHLPLATRDVIWGGMGIIIPYSMAMGGFVLSVGIFGMWMRYIKESKDDYLERERIKEKKERKKKERRRGEEERRKRAERKASLEKYRKLEEERKERKEKHIPEKIVVSYPAEDD